MGVQYGQNDLFRLISSSLAKLSKKVETTKSFFSRAGRISPLQSQSHT